MVSSQVRRSQVALAVERGHSDRRACKLIGIASSVRGYRPVRAERDAPVIAVMKRPAQQYPRYVYCRIRIFLKREGRAMS